MAIKMIKHPPNKLYKSNKILLFFVFTCLLVSHILFSQTDDNIASHLTKNLQALSNNQNSDVVYLQTDKDKYFTEEQLWFKGTVLDSKTNTPSHKSHILFVQLIEEKTDTPVWEEKYEIENGFVDGHLFLSDSLASGTYRLAGYSSHSYFKNQNEFYAFKKIKILKDETQDIEETKPDAFVHFTSFPEGGHLVSGLESRLAFEAVNSKGYPVEVSGTLYENDQALLEFKTTHAGMGSFMFTPDANKTYRIQLKDQNDTKIEAFPKIETQGKVLHYLGANQKDAFFKISQSGQQFEEKIYVRLQAKGMASRVAVGYLKDDIKLKIPLEDLPQGIAEVTLFDNDLKPIAERLIYVNAHKKLYIKTSLDKSEYLTRNKVQLKLEVTDETRTPTIAHLGFRIFNHQYKNGSDSKTIETHYHLSSQLKGRLYNPSYYFNKNNINRKEALDVLLQTQGWRFYAWSETSLKERSGNEPLVFDYYKGKILKSLTYPQNMLRVFTFGDSLKRQTQLMQLDTLGRFNILSSHLKLVEQGNLIGQGYLYLQPLKVEPEKKQFELNNNYFEIINTNQTTLTNIYPLKKSNKIIKAPKPFVLSKNTELLEEVTIKTKKSRYRGDKQEQTLKTLLSDDYLFEAGGQIPSIHYPHSVYRSKSRKLKFGDIYTCQVPLNEGGNKGYRTFVYPNVPDFFSRRRPSLEEIMKQSNITRIKGFYEKKEYYQPVYDRDYIDDGFPDKRSTLFWKPDIITNAQGEATIEFYCSDINSLYLGEVEGVSGTGHLGRYSFELKVIKQDD